MPHRYVSSIGLLIICTVVLFVGLGDRSALAAASGFLGFLIVLAIAGLSDLNEAVARTNALLAELRDRLPPRN